MQIRFFSKEGWKENQFHYHDPLEIVLVMSEGGSFYIRNAVYPITRGSLFILNSGDLHRSVPDPQSLYQFYSIRFYPEEADSFSTDTFDILRCFRNHGRFHHRVQLLGDQLDHLLKLINKMEYYLSVDCSAYGREVFIKTLLAEALVYVNFLYNTPPLVLPPDNEELSKLQPVVDYIQAHLAEDLSLDVLAQQVFLSKYYLSHRFKQVFGLPLSEYIIRRRLSCAKLLLRQGASVTLAGEQSGFNSSAHFIRTFVKYVGVSPKQYAKQYQTLDSYDSPTPALRDVFSLEAEQSAESTPQRD